MKKTALAMGLLASTLTRPVFAAEGPVPGGIPHLDHVFVILMENHGYSQIIGNPSAPFTNLYAQRVNSATNYFAVAHPSLTNYLEVVGGSNFGVLNDNSPDWHNATCTTNLALGTPSLDTSSFGNICPITGTGTDTATPVFDNSNETSPPAITSVTEIDGKLSIPAAPNTVGQTIADQLVEAGKTWKSYQESVTFSGANLVNYSDGYYDNNSSLSTLLPGASNIVHLYAVKHDPFAYFASVQEGPAGSPLSLSQIVGFEGAHGLFDDLSDGRLPAYSFIVPNQCNDQHGQNNASAVCFEDPNDDGTLNGLNPGLIYQGDRTLRTLVRSIHDSPSWPYGHNAIVIVWDENDYKRRPEPEPRPLDGGHQLRDPRTTERQVLYALLAAPVDRRGPRPALPQPRLRPGHRGDVRFVRPLTIYCSHASALARLRSQVDDLSGGPTRSLIGRHLVGMHEHSPPTAPRRYQTNGSRR